MNMLFVCTGNTCRSPMAEAIFNHTATEGKLARSAGLFAMNGAKASRHACEVIAENGMRIEHSSRLLDEQQLAWATLVLTMTISHKYLLLERFPETSGKVFTLKEYVHMNQGGSDVQDPYGGQIDVYRATFAELEQLITRIPQ